jgi:dephospho-CoA kinase
MLRVGLTGGIACGKSRVRQRLADRGLATLDLDQLAHEVMAPGGAAYDAVVAAFGARILAPDGRIDRAALGGLVFSDPAARSRLDALVHPRVREEEATRTARLEAAGHGVVVSDAALLVEAGVHLRFDRLVVVHCAPEEQRRRLVARDGMTEDTARARVEAQMPIAEKRRFAHLEVDTSGSLSGTDEAAETLAGVLLTEARGPRPGGHFVAERALGALLYGGGPGPRGLDARRLLEAAAASGGLEMPALALRLEPPAPGPWYRVARPDETEPWPEALAAPLALWTLARGGDVEWLLGAAASLARLTHDGGAEVAGACLAALNAWEVASAGNLHPLEDRSGEAEDRARRWGGASPAPRVRRAFEAAVAHPADPAAAGAAAGAAGAEPALAAALVGLAKGVAPSEAGGALVSLVARMARSG